MFREVAGIKVSEKTREDYLQRELLLESLGFGTGLEVMSIICYDLTSYLRMCNVTFQRNFAFFALYE